MRLARIAAIALLGIVLVSTVACTSKSVTTFSDGFNGFSISLPDDWLISHGGFQTVFLAPSECAHKNIGITVSKESTEYSDVQIYYTDKWVHLLPGVYEEYNLVSLENLMIDDVPAIKLIYTYAYEGGSFNSHQHLEVMQVRFIKEQTLWHFNAWSHPDCWDTYDDIIDTMLNSFHGLSPYRPESGHEAVYEGVGIGTAQATMQVMSNVYATGNTITQTAVNISFQLSSVLQDENVDLGMCVVNYQDDDVVDLNIGTLVTGLTGLLSPNEVVEVTIDVSGYALGVYDTFTVEIIPPTGATIQIQRTLPGDIESVMNLY